MTLLVLDLVQTLLFSCSVLKNYFTLLSPKQCCLNSKATTHKHVPPIQINVTDALASYKLRNLYIWGLKQLIVVSNSSFFNCEDNFMYWIFKEECKKVKYN